MHVVASPLVIRMGGSIFAGATTSRSGLIWLIPDCQAKDSGITPRGLKNLTIYKRAGLAANKNIQFCWDLDF
jgi:hypothetical protein